MSYVYSDYVNFYFLFLVKLITNAKIVSHSFNVIRLQYFNVLKLELR